MLIFDLYFGMCWFILVNVGFVYEEIVIIVILGFNVNLKLLFVEIKIVGFFLKILMEINNLMY